MYSLSEALFIKYTFIHSRYFNNIFVKKQEKVLEPKMYKISSYCFYYKTPKAYIIYDVTLFSLLNSSLKYFAENFPQLYYYLYFYSSF